VIVAVILAAAVVLAAGAGLAWAAHLIAEDRVPT